MASPTEAASLIRTGIYALLGLDQIDTLIADLKVVERKKRTATIEPKHRETVAAINHELTILKNQTIKVQSQKDDLNKQLENAETQLKALNARYIEHGGDLYEQRDRLHSKHDSLQHQLTSVETDMRRIAAGDAPLLLVRGLLADIATQAREERENSVDPETLKLIEERDKKLTNFLKKMGSTDVDAIAKFLEKDLQKRSANKGSPGPLSQIAPEPIDSLLDGPLQATSQEITTALQDLSVLQEKLAESDRKLAMIPDPEGLEGISAELQANEKFRIILDHKIEASDELLRELDGEKDKNGGRIKDGKIQRLIADRARLLESDANTLARNDKSQRAITRCGDLRNIMTRFKAKMTVRHLGQLENLILEGYQTLLRKGSLITQVKIDPDTFNIHLLNASAHEIPLDRLSAGERQLLAVSILWGLGKASGHTLPTVIDTPLGRLDGSHSHQVILLSTDKEIDEVYYDELKNSIGRTYNIGYDDEAESSQVTDGYFWRGAA